MAARQTVSPPLNFPSHGGPAKIRVMADDPEKFAIRLRAGADRILGGAKALDGRAAQLPKSLQRHMLKLQAEILREGAAELKDRALAVQPTTGRA